LCRDGEDTLEAALRIAPVLDGGCLAVQGPPGSGKTYLGAAAIVELVRRGKVVGVTANSHKVIGHLLDSVAARAAERSLTVRIGQKPDQSGDPTSAAATAYATNDDLEAALDAGEVDVIGGTAWVWSRPEFAGRLDVLVVDEAGQLSLANAVAVSPAARGLILLGDPQQLDQPLQGTHPPGAEASALGHVLGSDSTMPADRGLFLEKTRRLHPDLCRFTSEAFYEGRLESIDGLERQHLAASGELSGSGVRFVPSSHTGNTAESPEEAEMGRRPDRGSVQRPGRRDSAETAPGACRDRGQVPGPGSPSIGLLHDDIEPRGCAARHGVPVFDEPPERGDVPRPRSCGSGGQSRARARPGANTAADATRKRAVPVHGDGRGSRLTLMPDRSFGHRQEENERGIPKARQDQA
jgi:hypothetical protein